MFGWLMGCTVVCITYGLSWGMFYASSHVLYSMNVVAGVVFIGCIYMQCSREIYLVLVDRAVRLRHRNAFLLSKGHPTLYISKVQRLSEKWHSKNSQLSFIVVHFSLTGTIRFLKQYTCRLRGMLLLAAYICAGAEPTPEKGKTPNLMHLPQ